MDSKERQASIDRANKMFAESRAAKEGQYGQERKAKMLALQEQIHALENGVVTSAKQATDNMAKARALREQLNRMEVTGFDVLEAQAFNGRLSEKKAQHFSDIQAGLLGQEAAAKAAIEQAWERVAFNPTIGVSRQTLDRQLAKLIAGEGESDQYGRYVRFSEGKSSAVYRAYVNAEGDYGFVAESRGSDANYNGLGSLAE